MIHTIHENYDHDGCYYQLLGDVSVNCKRFSVKETIKRHTGVRWLNIENWVDEFDTAKKALEKYPKAVVYEIS